MRLYSDFEIMIVSRIDDHRSSSSVITLRDMIFIYSTEYLITGLGEKIYHKENHRDADSALRLINKLHGHYKNIITKIRAGQKF